MVKLIDLVLYESGSARSTIKSELRVLLVHMLKCKYQNEYKSKSSWRGSILKAFYDITDSFDQKKSTKEYKGSLYKKFFLKDLDLNEVYRKAVRVAIEETGLSLNNFPRTCEWSKEDLINEDFILEFLETFGQDRT